MINHEKYFATLEDTADFLADCVTCFTCPAKVGTVEPCEGVRSHALCAAVLERWLEKVVEE